MGTLIINHEFFTNCKGYHVTSELAFDTLMNPNAYLCVDIEEKTVVEHHTLSGLLDSDVAIIDVTPNIDILSQDQQEDGESGPSMTDPDPPHKINDGPSPSHRVVHPPDTDPCGDGHIDSPETQKHHHGGDPQTHDPPEFGTGIKR